MKTRIDLSDVVNSPEFQQPIAVERGFGGKWYQGKFEQQTKTFTIQAVVSATDEKEIVFVPEGDRNSTNKTFHTTSQLYITREDTDENGINDTATSDIVIYNNDRYKIVAIINAGDYGYFKSVGSKMGASN